MDMDMSMPRRKKSGRVGEVVEEVGGVGEEGGEDGASLGVEGVVIVVREVFRDSFGWVTREES